MVSNATRTKWFAEIGRIVPPLSPGSVGMPRSRSPRHITRTLERKRRDTRGRSLWAWED